MKTSKIFTSLAVIIGLMTLIVPPAQANCPTIDDIIKAFNKNGLPPRGWLLVSYTGDQIDKSFHFENATWNAISTHLNTTQGNIVCEYSSRTKTNPGFLIVETAATLLAPQDKEWRRLANGTHTAVCEGQNPSIHCQF